MNKKNFSTQWLVTAFILCAIILAGYVWVYQLQPFAQFWNDFWSNALTILASLFAFGTGLMVLSSYTREDAPFKVWAAFSLGFFIWMLAEVIWAAYDLIYGEVPMPGLADFFWYLGYVFFAYGFICQYRLIYHTTPSFEVTSLAIMAVVIAILTAAITALTNDKSLPLSALVEWGYPLADLAVVVFAIGLVWAFRGGALARPWIGMLVFSVSDAIYAWLAQTGMYAWSVENGNTLSLLVDTLYVLAYLVVGIGFLLQYLLLKYGPRVQLPSMDMEAD